MRRIMSLWELRRYYEGRSPSRILFCSENQELSKIENPLKSSLVFTSMVMACNPNVICLRNGDSMVWFERVKNVIVDPDRSPLGTVLDIVCGDMSSKENDIRYTVIAI